MIRDFDDIPIGARFADKFGRVFVKKSSGSATDQGHIDEWGNSYPLIDESREYFEFTKEDLEDDPFVFDTWPYYLIGDAA